MLYFIEFLRTVACVLITNSHFKGVYPNDAFAFGGTMGVGLFYMISGYLSASIKKDTHFGEWYTKKLMRLYVPLVIWKAISVMLGDTVICSVGDFIREFIFPGTWFGASMVILYIVYYLYVKYLYLKYEKKAVFCIAFLLLIIYGVMFVGKPSIATFSLSSLNIETSFGLKTMYLILMPIWLLCMVIGLWIKKYQQALTRKIFMVGSILLSLFCCMLFMLIRRFVDQGISGLEIALPIAFVGFDYFLFRCFMSCEKFFSSLAKTLFGELALIASKSTLEIFYVQFIWIDAFGDWVFPLNLLVLIIGISVSGCILHSVSSFTIKNINLFLDRK